MLQHKPNYQFITLAHIFAAACFAAAAFINAVNGVIFLAVITAILVPINLFLSYEAFKKMIKEK